jgi:hypothetical protein
MEIGHERLRKVQYLFAGSINSQPPVQIQAGEPMAEAKNIEIVQAHLLKDIGCVPLDDLESPPWSEAGKP